MWRSVRETTAREGVIRRGRSSWQPLTPTCRWRVRRCARRAAATCRLKRRWLRTANAAVRARAPEGGGAVNGASAVNGARAVNGVRAVNGAPHPMPCPHSLQHARSQPKPPRSVMSSDSKSPAPTPS
eukprot:3154401-Pleurochrysis_carterae.AAC.1